MVCAEIVVYGVVVLVKAKTTLVGNSSPDLGFAFAFVFASDIPYENTGARHGSVSGTHTQS